MPTYIVLLGPPGAGKGTQAKVLAQKFGLPHISSGDIFRENLKNGTELGKLAQTFMSKGELVPDDVTIAMIRERFERPDCENGAILDGFPRTPTQADALENALADFGGRVNLVPYITAPEEVLIERLAGRWTCRAIGHIFHEKFNPPQQPGRCDLDGSELYQRDDDKAETVKHRIQVYLDQTSPLIEYYRSRGTLVEINGFQPIEQVSGQLMTALKR
ncbi:MAG: adenylate kinase [Anaerolineae bacterium CG_4_9_14_3_um_filter_57_17]|nr:adenylate kinase [bacterium]NCT20911.1 adenylate kinase [bacterium]OIO85035.1 MAG: adenylate kinase [Anaerolineae bacterium CG2_30_57_67]PJB68060.1 MAG: adenylate kinase [Anaerolineae bacterium CG_4_9_14_3_um_filter_57_17]